jgi:hypothetical protein
VQEWNNNWYYSNSSSTLNWSGTSAVTYTVAPQGNLQATMTLNPTPPRKKTEVEQLLDDVEAVCVMGR